MSRVNQGSDADNGVGIHHNHYVQSLEARKVIQDRIKKSGTKSDDDKNGLKHHTRIINDYERYNRQVNKSEKIEDEQNYLNRYRSAKTVVSQYNHSNLSKMTDKRRKMFIANKAIVDEYEKSQSKRNNQSEDRKIKIPEKAAGGQKVVSKQLPPVKAAGGSSSSAGAKGPNAVNVIDINHNDYVQSLEACKVIQHRTKTSGTKSKSDRMDLKYHKSIIKDYKRYDRQFKKTEKLENKNIEKYLKRCIGSKVFFSRNWNLKKKNSYISQKAISDAYEKSLKRKNAESPPTAQYEDRKEQLLKQAELINKSNDIKFSMQHEILMKSLMLAGVAIAEAKLLALHSSTAVQELIQLRNYSQKEADITKQLLPIAAADTMSNKLKADCHSANNILRKYANSDLDKLTEKQKAIIRISLRRLRSYNLTEGKETSTTRFDVLLTED